MTSDTGMRQSSGGRRTTATATPRTRRAYVIHSPLYRETNGGAIVLHRLAALLRDAGETVRLWPVDLPAPGCRSLSRWSAWLWRRLRWTIRGLDVRSPLRLHLATPEDINDAIVVYPELIRGNPLGARHVVRWLLSKPSEDQAMSFGSDDCFFYFLPQFDIPQTNGSARSLHVLDLMRERYRKTNDGVRSGACYMVRKGHQRTLDQHPPDAICLDGLSHERIAEHFNRHRTFISYDLYTLYSRYAAMCGCIPIVIPEPGLDKLAWRPEETGRLGIAYGHDDIDWAVQTRDALLHHLDHVEEDSRRSVAAFIEITQSRFPAGPPELAPETSP